MDINTLSTVQSALINVNANRHKPGEMIKIIGAQETALNAWVRAIIDGKPRGGEWAQQIAKGIFPNDPAKAALVYKDIQQLASKTMGRLHSYNEWMQYFSANNAFKSIFRRLQDNLEAYTGGIEPKKFTKETVFPESFHGDYRQARSNLTKVQDEFSKKFDTVKYATKAKFYLHALHTHVLKLKNPEDFKNLALRRTNHFYRVIDNLGQAIEKSKLAVGLLLVAGAALWASRRQDDLT